MKKLIPIALFLVLVGSVFAQQVSLSISPPLIELVAKPGKSVLIAYTVQNLGDPAVLRTRVVSFYPKNQTGGIDLKEELEGPIRFNLDNADIQLEQPFFLTTRQSQQILLNIRVPEGAPEGDYYYTLIAEADPSPFQEGASVSRAQARIGANILVTVTDSGRVDIKGKIPILDTLARFKFNLFGRNYRIFDSGDKIPVVLIVENSGKNAIKPNGKITMKGPFGGTASYEILPQNILALSQRQIIATPSAELGCQSEGQKAPFHCRRMSSLVLEGFFLGNYRLSASVNFGEGSPNISAETSFLALPIKFALGILGVTIIILFVVRRSRKQEDSDG